MCIAWEVLPWIGVAWWVHCYHDNLPEGFTRLPSVMKSYLSFFDRGEYPNLIQIDFYTHSDWVIDEKLENG
jgi:hypothetical protein